MKAIFASKTGSEPAQPMVDSLRRTVNYLRVSLTDRCNLRCTYCMPQWGTRWMPPDTLLTDDELVRVVRLAAARGVYKVRVTGGEPLLRRGAVDLVRRFGQVEGVREVVMTTNGILLAGHAQALYRAGLNGLNMSLDSLDPERFARITRGNRFDRVWRGLIAALDAGIESIKLNCVVQKGVNDDEVADFVRLTHGLPLDVRFIEFMPVSDWHAWRKQYVQTADIRRRITRELGPLLPQGTGDPAAGPAQYFRIQGHMGRVGFIPVVSDHFCESCNRVRLSADGKIRPCLFGDVEMDLREKMRAGASDRDLNRLIDQALAVKPDGHHIDAGHPERMLITMAGIGG